MKKATLLSSLLTAVAIISTGCTKSQINKDLDKTMADINRQMEETRLENERLINDASKILSDGGQPGPITLNGVLAVDADKLDSRITVSQSTGLNKSGSATTVAKTALVINSLESSKIEKLKADLKKKEDERTYINLGCELAESEIAGLTDVTAKTDLSQDVILLSASRIFVCGEQKLADKGLLSLSASEIMLKDASMTFQKNTSLLGLSTGTLILIGKNKIASIAKDDSGYILAGASINLTVTNEIYGDGELALESKGGNNIAEQKKDSK